MYAQFLRAVGFAAIEVDNAADGLALAPTVDVIVTEMRVPGAFDGLELVRRLRANPETASKPIIVLTASAFAKDERNAQSAGCDLFLTKPCLPETLATELRRALADRLARHRPGRARRRTRRDIA
jgi:CheY-like chemotaxis protein